MYTHILCEDTLSATIVRVFG